MPLSVATLNRASSAYRRGYSAGYWEEPIQSAAAPGTFAAFDYTEGFKAGANDRRVEDARLFHSQRALARKAANTAWA